MNDDYDGGMVVQGQDGQQQKTLLRINTSHDWYHFKV